MLASAAGNGGIDVALWNTDMTTDAGARVAAQNGGYACFAVAVLMVIGNAISGEPALWSLDPVSVVFGLGIAVFVVAGLRLRAGKGIVLGSLATALLIFDTVRFSLFSFSLDIFFFLSLIVIAFLLVGMINGVRGARALRRGIVNAGIAEIVS